MGGHSATHTSAARRFTHTLALTLVAVLLVFSGTAFASPAETDNIYGSVSDMVSAKPIANVRVDILRVDTGSPMATVYTDASGEYYTSVPAGTYVLRFSTSDNAYAPVHYPNCAAYEDAERITLGDWPTMASVSLNRAARLSGEMVDLYNGQTLPEAQVIVEQNDAMGHHHVVARATADETGHFDVTGLNPGSYTVATTVDGIARYMGGAVTPEAAQPVVLASAQVEDVTFAVNTDVQAPTTALSGVGRTVPRNRVVRFKAEDDKSGVASTYFRINGGSTVRGSSVRLTRLGFNVVEYYSVDSAGNEELMHRQVLLVTAR